MKGPDPGQALSSEEIDVLITIERIGAGCSMVAIVLTTLSYWAFKKIRTTPNLFLLFASMANAGASVASMVGYDGLQKGEHSSLCQAQAFIFEWFMQSDPWWSFAMAMNVYLVFFYNADPRSFRKYAWVYCVVCFGGPMIPAVVLISIRPDPKGPIFGDAALWCWIGTDWSMVRIYSYYIPVWLCISLSIVIYVAVGYHVFHHRNQLRHIAADQWEEGEDCQDSASGSTSEHRGFSEGDKDSFTRRPEYYGTAVTEVQITSDLPQKRFNSYPTLPSAIYSRNNPGRGRSWAFTGGHEDPETGSDRRAQRFETVCSSDRKSHRAATVFTRLRAVRSDASLKLKRLDPVKMAYLRTSFIFGFAVLITWIPSSINRLYSLTHDNKISFPLSIASGCVLPLQGVWNALIYFTTSWSTVREEVAALQVKWYSHDLAKGAVRLESRLDVTKGGGRNTFERSRIPYNDHSQCGTEGIEMEEPCDFQRR